MVECMVPIVREPSVFKFAMMTNDSFLIESRAYNFSYFQDMLIEAIVPYKGGLEGGYTFRLEGKFDSLVGEPF